MGDIIEMIERKKEYSFEFSVVMAIYNVALFLEEALNSIVNQTIGFENIQMILVDDGSTDESGQICDLFGQKYPEQITVVHKVNGGPASARNVGLPFVKGKYVSFLDPDDYLDVDAFEKAERFLNEHEETDVCCIPLQYFGNMTGPHTLNYKFSKGTRVVDLSADENYDCTVMSCASSFFRSTVVKQMHFDTELYTAEDAKVILGVLIRNPHLGLLSDSTYHYRKHGNSILDAHASQKKWYLTYLEHFSQWAIETATEIFGFVPKFIQYTVMYDLQWKLRPAHIPSGVLSEEETEKYQSLLFQLASYMDDDVILSQKSLPDEVKLFLLRNKHSGDIEYYRLSGRKSRFFYGVGHNLLGSLDSLVTRIHFIRFEEDNLVIEASQFLMGEDTNVNIQVRLGDLLAVEAEAVSFDQLIYSADVPIGRRYYYRARLPLHNIELKKKQRISFYTLYDAINVEQEKVVTDQYAPISSRLHNSYFINDSYLLTPAHGGVWIQDISDNSRFLHVKKEIKLLKELIKKSDKAARKAFFARVFYYLLKPFMPDDIWLITDKADRADDNGEAFFRYITSLGKDSKCHPVFSIGKEAPAYRNLKKIGTVVPYMSWRYKLIHLFAQHTISAYSHNEISNPFGQYAYYYCDLMQRNQVVFLQHGIIKDDLSPGLNRYHKNFALFVTSVKPEWLSVVEGNYGYSKDQILLSGLPRYDFLYNNTQKYITVMPTWSQKLCGQFIPEESRWELLPGFEQSLYYQFYSNLLNNNRLLEEAQRLGYTIRFLIHPVFLPYVDRFKLDSRVKVFHQDVCYRDVFAESALITTDYSSVAFDFAYLKKPIIYTQFEENHYEEGYFDYERDGFGEVEHTVDSTVDRLIEYMREACAMKPKYLERVNQFFLYHDQNNSKRVYNAIRRLDGFNN